MQITPLGDSALMLVFGDWINESIHRQVQTAWRALAAEPLPGVSEVAPAYTTVTVFYDVRRVVEAGAPENEIVNWLSARVRERLKDPPKSAKVKPRHVEIPVCYGGEYGPDLGRVAAQAKLFPDEVVKRHSRASYRVHLIGFAPGFPYLGGLPKELVTPRHAKPRMSVPVGSVAIGGEQTGIYPQSTPGGWNLIGRTPLRLFRPEQNPPVLLQAGDEVTFKPITPAEFAQWQEVRA
ncbi:Kinase A inhibitor [Lacunisphaera limnophila]|uniref:Kinase A inhibitor n=1 Tax=Lacunisphaera limnophila TaxID=1838286 RepID=A0A1D8AZB6_9BACT|nr:5-oxoprolinase subunit PxpB [Lacunisphaera limnophila]AOS46238.1 Kinase A inhibitor [Lacunisphaera limnophila]